jgi:pyridoxamine 5'-phosphate oxidase
MVVSSCPPSVRGDTRRAAAGSSGGQNRAVPDLSQRRSYTQGSLAEDELAPDWPTQFARWYDEVAAGGLVLEPNAMVVGTADAAGRPSLRTVLLRSAGPDGFVFFTNYGSRKGRELAANPAVSLLFSWVPAERQVVVTGTAERVSRAETEAYWATRPRESRLASAASAQSAVVPSRAALEADLADLAARYPGDVPVPDGWGGFRVVPDAVEFWQGRPARLHDRLRFRRVSGAWIVERLSP